MDDDAREEVRKGLMILKAVLKPIDYLIEVADKRLDPVIPEIQRRLVELAKSVKRLEHDVVQNHFEIIARVAEVYPWTRSEAKRERLRHALENTGRFANDVDAAILDRFQRWVLELSDLAVEIMRTTWEMRNIRGPIWPKRSEVRERMAQGKTVTRQLDGLFTAGERELEGLGLIVREPATSERIGGSDWELPLNELAQDFLAFVAAPPESTPLPSTREGEGAA